jgi:hypothetical protein
MLARTRPSVMLHRLQCDGRMTPTFLFGYISMTWYLSGRAMAEWYNIHVLLDINHA